MIKSKCGEDFQFGNKHTSLWPTIELNYKTWTECMNSYLKTLKSKYYRWIQEKHKNSKYHQIFCAFTVFPPAWIQHNPKPRSEHMVQVERGIGETL